MFGRLYPGAVTLDPLSGNKNFGMVTIDWQHSRFRHHPGAVTISHWPLHSVQNKRVWGTPDTRHNTYSFRRADRGSFVKGSACSWIDGSWSQTLTACSDYLGQVSSTCCWSCHLHFHSITSCHLVLTDYMVVNASQPTAPPGSGQFQHRGTTRVPALVTTLAHSPIVLGMSNNWHKPTKKAGQPFLTIRCLEWI